MSDLQAIADEFSILHTQYLNLMSSLPLASAEYEDSDIVATLTAEGIFLRCFTLWEKSIEKSFLYFCLGGSTLANAKPSCRITNCTADQAKKIMLVGRNSPYLDWSDEKVVREFAVAVFEDGFPFSDPIAGSAQLLSDTQRIRNLIAHDSSRAWNAYLTVQRNNYGTERLFTMPAGHLLRTRRIRKSESWGAYYLSGVSGVFRAIVNATTQP